jgi:hypothetical protein
MLFGIGFAIGVVLRFGSDIQLAGVTRSPGRPLWSYPFG